MAQVLLAIAILAAVLVCPAIMWLGRRGIGPGCAMCLPRGQDESLEELRARERRLAAQIRELDADQRETVATHD